MSVLHEIKTHKVRAIKTFALFCCFIAHGLVLGVVGPTLMDLQVATGTSIDKISYIIPSRAVGFGIGTFCSGLWYSRVNILLIAGMSTATTGLIMVAIPLCHSIYTIIPLSFIMGIVLGFVDTSFNVFLIHIWGMKNPPFLHALHFCYGVGALISPLVARPFLLRYPEKGGRESLHGSQYTREDVQLVYPYFIIAGYFFLVSMFFWILWKVSPQTPRHPSSEGDAPDDGSDDKYNDKEKSVTFDLKSHKRYRRLLVIALICLFMHLYCGLEIIFGDFISPFVVKSDLHMSQQTGALISSVFWIALTFCRLGAVFFIDYIGVERNIFLNLTFIVISSTILLPFGTSTQWGIWAGSVFMGLGLSSTWPSIYGFMEQYFHVTSRIAASLIISASIANLTIPAIISPLLTAYPQIFVITTAVIAVGMITLFTSITILCRRNLTKRATDKSRG